MGVFSVKRHKRYTMEFIVLFNKLNFLLPEGPNFIGVFYIDGTQKWFGCRNGKKQKSSKLQVLLATKK